MTLTFNQGDSSVTVCGQVQACAAQGLASAVADHLALVGGTLGSVEDAGIGVIDGGVTNSVYMFEMAPAATDWAAGTATLNLNVSTGNMQMDLDAVYFCQRSAACGAIATYGSATGLAVSLTTAQVYSQNVTVSAITAALGDLLYVVVQLQAGGGMNQTVGITPSETIVTPINAPVVNHREYLRRYAEMRAPYVQLRM